jgi:hypothetical protein
MKMTLEQALDWLIEHDPDLAQRFIEKHLARIELHKRLKEHKKAKLDKHVLQSHNFRCGSIETISEDKTMKHSIKELDAILDTPYTFRDCSAENLRLYFYYLLDAVWVEGEDFSGKRPFGNSDWETEVYAALIAINAIYGRIDEDGRPWRFNEREANQLISKLILRCTGADRYFDQED